MSLSNQPVRQYTKQKQTQSKRSKPTQRQLGNISTTVDKELKKRSGGMCEVKKLCRGNRAIQRAHIMGRRIIPHKTTIDDLFHVCLICHKWLDENPEGIIFKRSVKEIGTTKFLQKRGEYKCILS